MNTTLRFPTAHGPARRRLGLPGWLLALLLALALAPTPSSRADIQFDVFVGFDERLREAHWFPVAFEILNDGPAFTGTVSLAPDGEFDGQRRDFRIELPTGTRKVVNIPVFSTAGRVLRWEARLQNESGKLMAERSSLQPRVLAAHVPMLGALPRTFAGLPTLPELSTRAPDYTPTVARLQPELLPSNPIAYESLTACYLNSEKAADLKPEQVDALLAWLNEGGHLIVAIESPTDITAVPWLRNLLPFTPEALETRPLEGSFERWLSSGKRALQLPSVQRRTPAASSRRTTGNRPGRTVAQPPANAPGDDPFTRLVPHDEFNRADMPIIRGRTRDGETLLGLGTQPLIQTAPRGRGNLTVLAFSPEREPFRGWKNRPWFWAKLLGASPELFANDVAIRGGGPSIDGLFGAMLDSRQVRKLPVAALLLILVVYLAVIGPFDQWILKRLGKQMWTWVTFPVYVAIFSGLIYFIGYRLRAGQLEWNELQVVDQLPRGDDAVALRGRTWASLYSPANARYRLASDRNFATLRSELQPPGSVTARAESSRMLTHYPGQGVDVEAYVPVWVNQLFASDWLEGSEPLLSATLRHQSNGLHLTLTNRSTLRFEEVRLAYGTELHDLGRIAPGTGFERLLTPESGASIEDQLTGVVTALEAAQQRRNAFGSETSGQLARNLHGVVLASLSQRFAEPVHSQRGEAFTVPASFDLDPQLRRGDALLFAWAPGQTIAPNLARFSPVRMQRDTALRMTVPVVRTQ